MKQKIYLVGQISPKFEETYRWRRNIIDVFEENEEINFIDPCANPFNSTVLKNSEYAVTKENRANAIDVLPSKDYTFCRNSTMAVVNMNHYDKNKPMLGTFFELAWYFAMPEKTVIGFADDLSDYSVQHPFTQQAVTVWCGNEYEAAEIIRYYFTTKNGLEK